MPETSAMQWFNIRDWGVEGQGWSDTLAPYDRLPARAETLVPPTVWDLSRSAVGICAFFETDAPAIHARWQLRSPQLGEANFQVAAFSGRDLFGTDGEASLDASHPSDLGFMRMADTLEPILRAVVD
jgi:hypothetical protein